MEEDPTGSMEIEDTAFDQDYRLKRLELMEQVQNAPPSSPGSRRGRPKLTPTPSLSAQSDVSDVRR